MARKHTTREAPGKSSAPRARKRLKIGLYINEDQAGILNLTKCLRNWDISFVSIRRDELVHLKPGDVDVLLLHGGWYGFEKKEPARQALHSFVQGGGGCIGICCGAIVICRQKLIRTKDWYLAPSTGWMRMSIQTEKHPIVKGSLVADEKFMGRHVVPIVYFNGPHMVPENSSTVVVGSYDPEGRVGSVLADHYGQGRVVAFGPHPEKEQIDEVITTNEPLPRASLLLHNALYWAARRRVPKRQWEFAKIINLHGSLRPVREYKSLLPKS